MRFDPSITMPRADSDHKIGTGEFTEMGSLGGSDVQSKADRLI
jgi:hypothetical protein